ncbi:MAG TPA: hypothetical protein VNW97_20015 [Candidatus Saccharimonadales bacterium]|jgi:hypothetical protein|nr:hypothetical protein [Candidatus Saccharimonadales bacterium]
MTIKKLILVASLALVFSVCAFANQVPSTVSPGSQITGGLPLTGAGMKVLPHQLSEKNVDAVAARAGDIVIAFHAVQYPAAARAGDIVIAVHAANYLATAKAGDIVIAFNTGEYPSLAV